MKEVIRGLLVLILAVGVSTVFVGCDVDDGEEGAGGAEAGGAEAGGSEEEAGGSDTAEEAEEAAESEIAQMMMQVEEDIGVDANGGLGDGCRDSSGVFGYCANTNAAAEPRQCTENGGALESGLCADSAGNTMGNVECCTGFQCGPSSNPTAGICAPETACDTAGGSSVMSGLCPGGATIKCCLPDEDTAAEMQAEDDSGD